MIDAQKHPNKEPKDWHERVAEILGVKLADKLIYVAANGLQGFILGKIQSGSSYENAFIRRNITYMFLNGRPIDPLKPITNLLDSIYRRYNSSTKYVFVLNILPQEGNYDVNLTPNKR